MANNKRPPLELDELTNNLKQSSGQGVDAFFSSQPAPQEEKKPVIREEQEEQDKEHSHNGTLNQVLPVPGVPPVLPVPPVPGVPLGRLIFIKINMNLYSSSP
jgi:hypothetical protein